MDIFESLEELNVSEKCFEDIINIVEEYINELKRETIISARNQRVDNYRNALNAAIQNPQDKNKIKDYMKTSDKLANNSQLSYNAFKRHGDTKNAEIVSPENAKVTTAKYKNYYETSKKKAEDLKTRYNNALDVDRHSAGGNPLLDNHSRDTYKDSALKAQAQARQARKYYHDTMDMKNTVPRDVNTLKQHLEYQQTHDSQGNRIK